jgi:nucleotide-binding universal stress UspA family protein
MLFSLKFDRRIQYKPRPNSNFRVKTKSIEKVLSPSNNNQVSEKMMNKIRIIVGYDDSPQSKKAITEAITIAKCFSGFIKIVYVYEKGTKGKTETAIIEVKEKLRDAQVEHEISLVQGSNPAKTLLKTAKQEDFDLIAVGSRGLGNTLSILLGSVSKQVVTKAQCNVLVVKN